MMARSTKKASTKSHGARKASPAKKSHAKKTVFQKLLTAEGWKRLMTGKMRKKSK